MANSLPTTVVLLSVLLSGLFYADGRAVDLAKTVGDHLHVPFDLFSLAYQWPATFCSTHENKCCPENGCCGGPNSLAPPGFTIRKFSPYYEDGTDPSCCPGAAYDESEISSLLDALHTYWPILSCNGKESCNNKTLPFWAHQWEKHGTCTTLVTQNQYQFFLTALELYLEFNVTDVLYGAGITPSNTKTYSASSIVSAIDKAFGAPPQLVCKNSDSIKELRLCFTLHHKIRACVEPSNCPEYVRLPKFAFLDGPKTEDWLVSAVRSVV